MKQTQRTFLVFVVFFFGMVAGAGLGFFYGHSTVQDNVSRQLAQAESQLETLNQSHMVLIQEYNKLFRLRSADWVPPVTVISAPARSAPIGPEGIAGPDPIEEMVDEEADAEVVSAETPEAVQEDVTDEGATTEESMDEAATDDSDGATDTSPQADFEAISVGGTEPQAGPPPQPFRFTDLSTGEITSWEWDFGDGNTSTEQNPEHTILKCPGVQELCTVTLTVCGPGGCDTETKLDYLWVSESCTGC